MREGDEKFILHQKGDSKKNSSNNSSMQLNYVKTKINDYTLENENLSHNDHSDSIKEDSLKFIRVDEKDKETKVKKCNMKEEVNKKLTNEQKLTTNKNKETLSETFLTSNPGKIEDVSVDEQIEWMTAKSLEKSKHIKYWKILALEKTKCLDKYIQKNKELKEQLESSELELQLIEAEIQHWNKICQDGFEFASQIENIISLETQ